MEKGSISRETIRVGMPMFRSAKVSFDVGLRILASLRIQKIT